MTFEEYRRYDALGLAELVRKGEVSPTTLLDLAIQRAEAVNPQINAIIHPLYDLARKMAGRIDREAPFAGVPFLIKDLGLEVKGTPRHSGSRGFRGYLSDHDSYLVEDYRKAGLLFMGKTNTPEFGTTPFTEPELYGPTRNPWNLERTAGGSSGGSAAAVAAGITPLATASDGGGSIRIPAANCGLFGLKPSRGRLSLGPGKGDMWSGAVVEGCVSRSVRDTAALLDAASGTRPGEPYLCPPPERPYLEEARSDPQPLRIAYTTEHTLGQKMDTACENAVTDVVQLLTDLGHQVETVALPYHREDLTEIFLTMIVGEAAATVDEVSDHLGRPARPSDVEASNWAINLLGRAYSARDFARQRRRWNEIARRMGAFHQTYDLLLTPAVSMRPFPIGALQPSAGERRLVSLVNTMGMGSLLKSRIDDLAEKIFAYIPYTPFANMTGQPSMSVPLHWNEENLPVGVMFTGPLGREDLLLRLAGQLERARPWFNRIPDL